MSYLYDTIHAIINDELSDFEVNDIDGTLTITADVRIPVELPEDWELDFGDEYVNARIVKEISL